MRRGACLLLLCWCLAACGDDPASDARDPGSATTGPLDAGSADSTAPPDGPDETEPSATTSSAAETSGLEIETIGGELARPTDMILFGDRLFVATDDGITVEVDLESQTTVRSLAVGGDIATDGTTLWGSVYDSGKETFTALSADLDSGEVTGGPLVPVPFNVLGPELAGGYVWWSYVGSSTLLRQDPASDSFVEVDGVGTEFRDLQGDGELLWMPADEGMVVARGERIPTVLTTLEPDSSVNEISLGGSEALALGAASVDRYDAATGEPLGSIETPFPVGTAAFGGGGLWAASIPLVEGTVAQLDPETGAVLASLAGVVPTSGLVVGDDAAYAVVGEGDSDRYSLIVLTPTD